MDVEKLGPGAFDALEQAQEITDEDASIPDFLAMQALTEMHSLFEDRDWDRLTAVAERLLAIREHDARVNGFGVQVACASCGAFCDSAMMRFEDVRAESHENRVQTCPECWEPFQARVAAAGE